MALYRKLYWRTGFSAFLFLKPFLLITEGYWFSLASLVNPCWILSYFIVLCLLLLFPPNVVPDPFIPLSHLVIVVLFSLGSICCYTVSFWKHVQIICNPSFLLCNNSTNIVLTLSLCAVLGISLSSVLLANLYDFSFSRGSLFLLLVGFPVGFLVMVIYSRSSIIQQVCFCLDIYS